MDSESLLPRRALGYMRDMGVRAFDRLADTFEAPAPAEGEGAGAGSAEPQGVAALVEHWRTMSPEEKENFVERVSAAVVEVIALSAAVPMGLKLGKRAAKATGKVIRKKTKKLRKAAKTGVGLPAKKDQKKKKNKD